MISAQLRDLVAVAKHTAEQYNDDHRHTVGAGLLTASGRIVTGMNAYHFSGGPCAEVTALAAHAGTCPEDAPQAIVAVHGPTGRVIPPCGKCRQVLFDRFPDIEVVIRTPSGHEAVGVRDLLPHPFSGRAQEAPQRIHLFDGDGERVRAGGKRQTIRVDDPFVVGAAEIVTDRADGAAATWDAAVTAVEQLRRGELTEDHARRDGWASLVELHRALESRYPGLGDDDPVDVVSFELR